MSVSKTRGHDPEGVVSPVKRISPSSIRLLGLTHVQVFLYNSVRQTRGHDPEDVVSPVKRISPSSICLLGLTHVQKCFYLVTKIYKPVI